MPAAQLEGVIRHLRKVASRAEAAPVGDGELLDRFIARRDEAAFEVLVHRHGPMVLGVCKRILGNETDAEDAFQATFLVLVQKATSIVPRTRVANWLHGVAHKTALKAKAMNSRRRVKEREAGAAQGRNTADRTWDFLLEILDGELNALPQKYRAAVVLCDLEGLSYREAAGRLGCPQGTLSGRLTRARAMLAHRINRRCAPLTAAALPTLLAGTAMVSLPPSLRACTIRAGALLAAGKALSESAVSSKVALLAQGVLKMFLLSRLKTMTASLLIVAAVLITGSRCATWESARAAMPGDDPVRRSKDSTQAPAGEVLRTGSPAESREAAFVFRGADTGRKTVSLVVEGTSAPLLCLPIKDNIRVVVDGRPVGIDGLRPGCRVAIQLDSTNSVIQDIRSLERPGKATVLKNANELAHLDAPSEGEVLRALQQGPRDVPTVLKVSRDDIAIVTERSARQVDAPRFFPLVGVAELHHHHWKCTVYYSETVESSYPYPLRSKRPRVEVVYIDKNYLVPTK